MYRDEQYVGSMCVGLYELYLCDYHRLLFISFGNSCADCDIKIPGKNRRCTNESLIWISPAVEGCIGLIECPDQMQET